MPRYWGVDSFSICSRYDAKGGRVHCSVLVCGASTPYCLLPSFAQIDCWHLHLFSSMCSGVMTLTNGVSERGEFHPGTDIISLPTARSIPYRPVSYLLRVRSSFAYGPKRARRLHVCSTCCSSRRSQSRCANQRQANEDAWVANADGRPLTDSVAISMRLGHGGWST